MSKKPGNLHDHFFQHVMSQPAMADQLLREQLPAKIVALFAPEPSQRIEGSFIDKKLAGHQSDMLFRVALKNATSAYIHIVIEHKSQPDPLTPLQLLRYMTQIWARLPAGQAQKPLAPILPLVFYHGTRRWTVPRLFQDMFEDLPDLLRPFTPQFEYNLIDLGQIADQDLSHHLRLRAFLKALKYNPQRDFIRQRFLHLLVQEFSDLPGEDIYVILHYILQRHQAISKQDLEQSLIESQQHRKDEIMTGFLEEIGTDYFQRGLMEGKAKGITEGEAKGKAELLLKQLQHIFGDLPKHIEQRIQQARPAQLNHWSLAFLKAKKLSDIFN